MKKSNASTLDVPDVFISFSLFALSCKAVYDGYFFDKMTMIMI